MIDLGPDKISLMALKMAGMFPPQPSEIEAAIREALEDTTSKDYAKAIEYLEQMRGASKGG